LARFSFQHGDDAVSIAHSNTPPLSAPQGDMARDPVLDLLFDRACTMAARVERGDIGFIDAVDFLWTAAEFAGTVHRVGPDATQAAIAAAFMGVRRSAAA
jgi:hypothetical protein